jgi:hypothetical protein
MSCRFWLRPSRLAPLRAAVVLRTPLMLGLLA